MRVLQDRNAVSPPPAGSRSGRKSAANREDQVSTGVGACAPTLVDTVMQALECTYRWRLCRLRQMHSAHQICNKGTYRRAFLPTRLPVPHDQQCIAPCCKCKRCWSSINLHSIRYLGATLLVDTTLDAGP